MKLNAPIQQSELDTYDTDSLMSHIRTVITVFEYMGSEERDENGKTVEEKINNIVKNIVKQLVYAQDLWDEEHPGRPVPAARFFVEWLQDYFEEAGTRARAWIQRVITILRNRQRQASGARAEEIRLAIASFESQLSTVRIGTEWDIDWRDDDDEMDTSSG